MLASHITADSSGHNNYKLYQIRYWNEWKVQSAGHILQDIIIYQIRYWNEWKVQSAGHILQDIIIYQIRYWNEWKVQSAGQGRLLLRVGASAAKNSAYDFTTA